MTASAQRFFACICLLLLLVEGPILRSLVLCIEPGGTVNLEASLGGDRCGGCPSRTSDGQEAQASPTSDGCACVDIALELSLTRPTTERLADSFQLHVMAAPLVTLDPWQQSLKATVCPTLTGAPSRLTDAPSLVGSVVLRV